MTVSRLNYDFLTVLNGIVEGLNANDISWVDRWAQVQNNYLGVGLKNAHDGFAFRVWPVSLLEKTPDMEGLLVTKLSKMTETL
jgi:hypothetical protein